MPAVFDTAPVEAFVDTAFSIISQKVDLNIDFLSQSLSGSTQITVQPHTKDLKQIRLNCRQCRVLRATVEGRPAQVKYDDPYEKLNIRQGTTTVHQHDYIKSKIERHIGDRPEAELSISIPPRVSIQEIQGDSYFPRIGTLQRQNSDNIAVADTPTLQSALDQGPRFAPLKLYIEFDITHFRDGLHFVGCGNDDARYPHAYTKTTGLPGPICSLFPCLDNLNSRCMWEICIRCPKTLGDAFTQPSAHVLQVTHGVNGHAKSDAEGSDKSEHPVRANLAINLTEEERAMDLSVVCSGEITDNIVDPSDPTRRAVSFTCLTPVTARHVGFAIGPFEHVDLSVYRNTDGDDKLGQNAIKVHGFCLPGRTDELRNTCMPVAKGIDYFTVNYGSFPFSSYKLCFVDDLVQDIADTAAFSICSNRLLFPEDIIDPLDANTRILVHALAAQYVGVNIIPQLATDLWTITGISGFMTDMFMKKLAGNNEFRYRQKLASEKVFELDVDRFSIWQLGEQLDTDPSEYEFLALKSALVLFILDRRLTKASGSAGVSRIISRVFLNAKTGDLQNAEISTDYFQRTCEKLGHQKLDQFFRQWVQGAGCPIFHVSQRFNKKKLVVEMIITQKQLERVTKPQLQPSTFMREAKESVSTAWAPGTAAVFTGPMTIRIHEADGTPYEHIVEIKEAQTKFEIPYNTKYKRLKRSKRAKERTLAANGMDLGVDAQDDVLLYCLGDTLQSEDEVKSWRLHDWSEEEEKKMGMESYEWIRLDADFEWIGRIQLITPIYMYVSQLQQDRDVVAQYEAVQFIIAQQAHPLMSTILIRTLMDRRYFHGIRTLACIGLAKCARAELDWIGSYHLQKAFQEMYCFADSSMPRANDFSDRASYLVQCAIPRAMASIRDTKGQVPVDVRKFFVDKLKFNDNSNNEQSDSCYVSMLVTCLAESLAATAKPAHNYTFNFSNDDEMDEDGVTNEEEQFKAEAIGEMERYRRIDEYISSYHNTYTVTAISCIQVLSAAGAVKNKAADILQYTRPGNADNVRLRAFGALVDLKMARRPQILKYILHSLCDDPSPHFRERLLRVFGQALGSIALGDQEDEKPAPKLEPEMDSGLVLEQEVSTEVQHIDNARKTSPEAALSALKQVVANHDVLKSALWRATLSPVNALYELSSLLSIVSLLFESGTSLVTVLRYPRTVRVENLGKGKVRIYRASTWRTKPSKYKPLELQAWNLVQQYGLKYSGPLASSVTDAQDQAKAAREHEKQQKQREQLNLQAQIAAAQQQLQRAQQQKETPVASQMSPPPVPAPIGVGPKISLKRKQSVDLGARASSPKAQKVTKNQTANGRAASPKVPTRRSPSVPAPKVPSATPAAAPPPAPAPTQAPVSAPAPAPARASSPTAAATKGASKPRKRPGYVMIVRLPLGASFQRALDLQARPARPASRGATQTPAPPSASPAQQVPTPAASEAVARSPAVNFSTMPNAASWKVGGFREYAGPGLAVKTEVAGEQGGASSAPASGVSPMNAAWSRQGQGQQKSAQRTASPQPVKREEEEDDRAADGMPVPKPVKKFMLKLGARK